MSLAKLVFTLVVASVVSGCSLLQSGKLLAPESFGLTAVSSGIYVEVDTDEATRTRLREFVKKAESAIRTAYGGVVSQPAINACLTEGCYQAFGGGRGSLAMTYGQRILLSPRALDWHLIAHEWSHTEMSSRLTLFAWMRMPRWFDEGVAVAVSEAPEHSEKHWEYLVSANIPRPTRDELHTFKSMKQWLDAVHRYGDDQNIERKANGELELRPVYAAVGHELRSWLAQAGKGGLVDQIARMNAGEEFQSAYQAVAPKPPPDR